MLRWLQMSCIDSFSKEFRFLSNFYACKIPFEGFTYPSTEHAYQAAKCLNVADRNQFQMFVSAATAKKLGQKVKIRPDWDLIKLMIMEELVLTKFTIHKDLREMLLATSGFELIEGNNWGDTFWGQVSGVGTNHLGSILMKVRDRIRHETNI